MSKKMEQAFTGKSWSLRKTKLKQCLTPKVKRTISTDNILKWKKSSRSKPKTRLGSKPRR